MRFLSLILIISNIFSTPSVFLSGNIEPSYYKAKICISDEEKDILDLINSYRRSKGLSKLKYSRALTYVAKIHAEDLYLHYNEDSETCNLHSWSKNGPWEDCCYTEDHKKAGCMWFKPMEITSYTDVGYEIVFYSTYPEDLANMPQAALSGWRNSEGHNEIILNLNEWRSLNWNAVGAAVYRNYVVVWFGEEIDRDGPPEKCH